MKNFLRRLRSGRLPFRGIALGLGLALVAGLAIASPGFDVQKTPVDDASVWAIQNGDVLRYARVNTELGELDTVKAVKDPTAIVQTSSKVLLYSESNARVTDVSLSRPTDVKDEPDASSAKTPAGTKVIVSSGDFLAYLADGGVYAGLVSGGDPGVVNPHKKDEKTGAADPYLASAIAIDANGVLYSYSPDDKAVLRFSVAQNRVLGEDPVDVSGTISDITAVAGKWMLLGTDGKLWIQGVGKSINLKPSGDVLLQEPTMKGDAVFVADEDGLISVARDGSSAPRRLVNASGTPARPTVLGDGLFAAWLPKTGSGTLWSSAAGASQLDYAGLELTDVRQPVFQTNSARMILNDVDSGWIWTVPNGSLVPSSQNWSGGEGEAKSSDDAVVPPQVIDPKPPVAEPDEFGVRSGSMATLPVLLNDHDPNEDVLTVVPDSLTGLDPSFGTATVTNNGQTVSLQVAPGRTGSASFSYRVTDGSSIDGIVSEPASVTVTVVPDDVNTPPVWCGVPGCLAKWPEPQVLPGGTVTVDALKGWVDPEGDPIILTGASTTSDVGSVIGTPDGDVVYQHPDPNAKSALDVPVKVTVADGRGAAAEKDLTVHVTPTPSLTAEPFVVTAELGSPVLVDPRSHITGVTGKLSLVNAQPAGQSTATVQTTAGETAFTVTAPAPGNYLINYTVKDDVGQTTAFARVTITAAGTGQLTTAPVIAYVRPREDATIDVFSAVSNPAGKVLLLSNLVPIQDPTSSLSVDLVGQSLLRVSGSTDDGKPGRLGVVQYTVSDGSGDPASTASGEASIYLIDGGAPAAPIAVDDFATVRVGQHVDIPVLANDVAGSNAAIGLDPSSVHTTTTDDRGLAFAANADIRYVAPEEAGTYTVTYSAYSLGYPELSDTATVTITVVPAQQNAAPRPRDLQGRVLAGRSVSIPFDPFGVDPDGDSVVLDTVVTQPDRGAASIATDGSALIYTSPAGFQGQVQFQYQVRDPQGATGVAVVRIAVEGQGSNPRPVTASDYIQVGQGNQAVVYPLLNDIDPGGKKLTLDSVVPDAVPDSDEYRRLQAMITGQIVDGRSLAFTATDVLGPASFVYTVSNASGDTAQGRIVLTVVRGTVPDYPVVIDTILTATTRDKLPQGVDVVSGKVVWSAGDPSKLALSLWGTPSGFTVSGNRIVGEVPTKTTLVPFALKGKNFAGEEVTSYGFLKILGDADLKLGLIDPTATVDVKENQQVTFDMAKLVDFSVQRGLEIDATKVAASGQRSAASCAAASGTNVTYTADYGKPWVDYCYVPVRMPGDKNFTFVAVPIKVEPEVPVPELNAASLTVSPGSTATFDLTKMTTWQGRGNSSTLQYSVNYTGSQFRITQSGQTLTIVGKDDSRPGLLENVSISLSDHTDVAPASISLQVGLAPSTLPKGATVTQQCAQGSATSCSVTVIGQGGEVNPLPGTPLKVVSAVSPTNCVGMQFSANGGTSVTVTWTDETAGGTCTGSFTVQDAQGRTSNGPTNGTLTIDFQGLPKGPGSVAQTGYGPDSITLTVAPGGATAAYPALQGFHVKAGSSVVASCTPLGQCDVIKNQVSGTKTDFTVVAFNGQGESKASVRTTAWAYRLPSPPTVVATPVYDPSITSLATGAVQVGLTATDPDTKEFAITNSGDSTSTIVPTSSPTRTVPVPVGPRTIYAKAVSKFDVPPGTGPGGTDTGNITVKVAGLPLAPTVSVSAQSETSITLNSVAVEANSSDKQTSVIYVAYGKSASVPTCQVSPDGQLTGVAGAVASSNTAVISGSSLTPLTAYNVAVCVGNGFGAVRSDPVAAATWAGEVPADLKYDIVDSGGGAYNVQSPTNPNPKYSLVVDPFTTTYGVAPTINAHYCLILAPDVCGGSATATFTSSDRQLPAKVNGPTLSATACIAGTTVWDELAPTVTTIPVAAASVTYTYQYLADGSTSWTTVSDTTKPVPATAKKFRVQVAVQWSASELAGLPQYVTTTDESTCTAPTP